MQINVSFVINKSDFCTDDDALSGFLDEWHTRDYTAMGYNIVRVPVLPPEERLAFVLE